MENIINIIGFFGLFYITDACIQKYTNLQGVYYLIHCLHNFGIVWLTARDVWNSFTNFQTLTHHPQNMAALQLVFALHYYHIAAYWNKLRKDDWLHHILMIGIALPVGGLLHSGSLLGHSLFFTTGLPGGIDYFLLFLTRNDIISRIVEKRVNSWLNVWIRSPGCVSNAVLSIVYLCSQQPSILWYFGLVTAILNYWNGQYFMAQVLEDATRHES
jgi:hypothetical protein